jgi:rhamnose utilization protein RhaD (predicted bifunctional aldolase and dehydrogenase)
MTDINVTKSSKPGGWTFDVTISDEQGTTEHRVKLSEQYYRQLTRGAVKPDVLIRQSFWFLLNRETKEDIMDAFNLKQINRYFSDYDREIKKML